MSDIALDTNGDLAVVDAALSLVEDTETSPAAIAQEQKIALRFVRGEWFLNVLVGLPYFQEVFVKNPSIPALTVLYTRALLSVPGTLEVQELALDFGDTQRPLRRLLVDYATRAADGTIITDKLAVVL